MSRSALLAVLLAGSLGLREAPAQCIAQRLPAHSEYWSGLSGQYATSVVVAGLPGERSIIRLKPRPPFAGEGWSLDVLQAGMPVQHRAGGPGEMLVTDKIVFGGDGAVAVVIRHLGDGYGAYILRAGSKLPAGVLHPGAGQVGCPGPGPSPDFAALLRPGLDLRVKLRLPQGPDLSTVPVGVGAQLHLVPPPGAGWDSQKSLPMPEWPWPATWKQDYETQQFAHADYVNDLLSLDQIHARLRRQHVVIGKPKKDGGSDCMMPAVFPQTLLVEPQVVLPGETLHVKAMMGKPCWVDTGTTDALDVWLASPHAVDDQALSGLHIAGGLTISWRDWGATFDDDILVPADAEPGLYALQLRVEALEAFPFSAGNHQLVPVLIREP